jgi:hypothetical protein
MLAGYIILNIVIAKLWFAKYYCEYCVGSKLYLKRDPCKLRSLYELQCYIYVTTKSMLSLHAKYVI